MHLSEHDIEYISWALQYLRLREAEGLGWGEKEDLDNLISRFQSE